MVLMEGRKLMGTKDRIQQRGEDYAFLEIERQTTSGQFQFW